MSRNDVKLAAIAAQIPTPYTFTSAFPEDHFVTRFITYVSGCTDAAHEYFEAAALVLLATATPNMRARLRQYPNGLPTALYAILLGLSTQSRKSTVRALTKDVLRRVIPDALLAEQASPEAFVEQLAGRSGDSTAWAVDEIGEVIDRLHHQSYLSGLRGLLLELYEGGDYHYKRTTKKTKAGAMIDDALRVEQAHLSILGCTTPALFEILTSRDVSSGFLARFAVIMPTTKPARRPFFEAGEGDDHVRNLLTKHLHDIYAWARTGPRRVAFQTEALETVDHFCAQIEAEDGPDHSAAMLQRLGAMTVKVAMLAAVGRPAVTANAASEGLTVTVHDATIAVSVTARWKAYALALAQRVGENDFERTVARCLAHVGKRGTVSRRDVARSVKVSKDLLDRVQATLEDRGQIRVDVVTNKRGPDATTWVSA